MYIIWKSKLYKMIYIQLKSGNLPLSPFLVVQLPSLEPSTVPSFLWILPVMSYEWWTPTQYPSSSLLTESQQGSAPSSVQWNVGKSLWARHPFLLPRKDKAPRKEDLSLSFPFVLCPSFSFLPGMWTRCLEAVQPFWNHKDQSHTLWMGKKEEGRCLNPWESGLALVYPTLDFCCVCSLTVCWMFCSLQLHAFLTNVLFIHSIFIFPGGSDGKVSAYNAGDLGSTPGLARSPGQGNGNPLEYSCLENPMDGGTW